MGVRSGPERTYGGTVTTNANDTGTQDPSGGGTPPDAGGPRRRMGKGRALLIGLGALVVVLVIGGVILFMIASRTTAASTDTAIEDFRESSIEDRPAAPGLPAQGVYQYSVDGRETIDGGPLSVGRDLPSLSPRIVRHTEDGFDIEWRLSGDHVESWGYRLEDDGAHALFERSTLSVAGISATTQNEWSPPPLRLPADPEVGMTWTEEASSGDQRITVASEISGQETVDVGGTPVQVVLIASTIDYSGDVEGRIEDTSYYDPETGLEIRHISNASLDDGSSKVTTRWDATLRSLDPVR
jgi:hypothetical protein